MTALAPANHFPVVMTRQAKCQFVSIRSNFNSLEAQFVTSVWRLVQTSLAKLVRHTNNIRPDVESLAAVGIAPDEFSSNVKIADFTIVAERSYEFNGIQFLFEAYITFSSNTFFVNSFELWRAPDFYQDL